MKPARTFIPWIYQRLIIRHVVRLKRCAIWAGMGMGKTVSVLTALDLLMLTGDIWRPTLIIAPLRVARTTWPKEVKKWRHLAHLEVQPILGKLPERMRALDNARAHIFTINYENVPWLVDQVGEHWPFQTIVADESTRLKGFRRNQGTRRARALARVAHGKTDRFIELTGTCAPNGLQDLWGQIWFIDAGRRLSASFTAFTQRWFDRSFDGFNIIPRSYAQEQIEELLKDVCLSLDPKDYFDLEEPIKRVVEVELPASARKHYREMERDLFTELRHANESHEIEAFNAASKTGKCLQFASGAVYTEPNGKAWVEVHDEKIEALRSIIEESAGMPVLVAYHFKSDLARLKKAFPKGRELDQNPKTEDDWNAGKIPVLFAHPKSAGHGLNLQDGGNIIVFFSHDWDLELFDQIRERIGPVRQMQAGHNRPVWEYYIVAKGTMDEVVMLRRDSKRSVQDCLLEAMKQPERLEA